MSNVCEHGQLARTCLLCEMRDENLTLKREGLEALQEWAETEARLEAEIKNLRSRLAEQSALVSSAIVSAAFATGHGDSVIDMVNELIGQAESLRTQLADCRAVLRERGHEIWCGSNNCGHLYAGGFCGIGRDAHGPNGAAHEFVARHECICGYARVMGEG